MQVVIRTSIVNDKTVTLKLKTLSIRELIEKQNELRII